VDGPGGVRHLNCRQVSADQAEGLAAQPAEGARLGRFLPFPSQIARPISATSLVAGPAIPPYIPFMDTLSETRAPASFEDILADFELLDDWEDRYRYVIELGRKLEPLPESERTQINKVQGCVSQVWLATQVDRSTGAPRLTFIGDSDAHIVRGLIAILFALYSGKSAEDIIAIDVGQRLAQLHLKEHLTPQRSNGLMAMVKRIQTDAEQSRASPALH
jgi:cysteine desulfuration protein SufE